MALLALTLALLAMTVATRTIEEKPLDMVLDCFDDQYQGCDPATKMELPALNHSEFLNNRLLSKYKFKANVGDVVRLGQFVSLTLCECGIDGFRNITVFKAQTCHCVDIKVFFEYTSEEKVLIPLFEKFNVTKVIEKGEKVEIHLDSIGTYSKYNCEWLRDSAVGTWVACDQP
ncbi:hypothetical protein TURU_073160 [Turdus rufiventris]|nr:hypothetical protein TURU_073160 [Turdus rufiventris]